MEGVVSMSRICNCTSNRAINFKYQMSLKKTETLALDDAEDWGWLIPLPNTQPLPTYHLSKNEIIIGRNPECHICISDKRLSGKHCSITKIADKITLTDLSTNGTFLGSKKIGKGNTVDLKHLDEIWLLTASKVPIRETIGFKVQLASGREDEKRMKQEEEQEKEKKDRERQKEKEEKEKEEVEEKKRREEQEKKKQQEKVVISKFAQSIKDQITCSFCYEIMSIPVAIQPCNHRFCGGCLTELVNSKKDTCIQCRKEITTAVRDAAFTSIIEDYLLSHPDQKRDPKQQEQLKAKNIFGFDPIDVHQRIHGKKAPAKVKVDKPVPATRKRAARGRAIVDRFTSDLSASQDDEKDKCRECLVSRNGFQCSATQVHVGCHTCGKLIAQRDDPALLQCCSICTTYYCNLYFPPCKTGAKLTKLQDCRDKCKIDPELMRGNKFEFQAIRNYLLAKKLNSKDVFDRMLERVNKGKFSYVIDKKIMKVAPLASKDIKLDHHAVICDLCWNDLWFQMVLAFRMEISSELPANVRDRPICYWGINCRTMDHNVDHAKKYNHCTFQTRF